MSDRPDGKDNLQIVLKSRGIKKFLFDGEGENNFSLPKADLYIDCRAVREKGLRGYSGKDPTFQASIEEACPNTLNLIFGIILESLKLIPDRRDGKNPYSKPFVIMFFCAWGQHRSPGVKQIMSRRLREIGLNVEVEK